MKTLGDRVRIEREARGWSQGGLASKVRAVNPALRTKQSTIFSIERGESKKTTIIVELAKVFGVRPEWLRTGNGPKEPGPDGTLGVPILGYAGARERIDLIDGDHREAIDQLDVPGPNDDFSAIVVRGSSMVPAYRDGDYLLFRQRPFAPEQIVNTDCVVITERNRVYIKKVKAGRVKGRYDLLSYNSEHDPILDVEIEAAWPIEWIRRK